MRVRVLVLMLAMVGCHKKAAAPVATGPQNVTVDLEGGTYDLVSIPPGIECNGGTPCRGVFDAGTRITIRGAQDFPLVDFDGPCEQKYVHTCTFVVTGPMSLTATFHGSSN